MKLNGQNVNEEVQMVLSQCQEKWSGLDTSIHHTISHMASLLHASLRNSFQETTDTIENSFGGRCKHCEL